jgi:ribonuclease HII
VCSSDLELILKRAIAVGAGIADAKMIDRMNVLEATRWAMQEAVEQLSPQPDLLLVDGRESVRTTIAQRTVVGGDHLCASIAAASIVAKVTRDRMMAEIDAIYPAYGFKAHKGYGTRDHQAKLLELGPCPEHRMSFAPVRALSQCVLPLQDMRGEG